MIDLPLPATVTATIDGTVVTTTFNRLRPTGSLDEYELLWVLDNNGSEQVTSNGVTILSPSVVAAITA